MAQWGTKSKEQKKPAASDGWQVSKQTRRGAVSPEAVAKRAYEKWLARGGNHGDDLTDWLEAEKELSAEANKN